MKSFLSFLGSFLFFTHLHAQVSFSPQEIQNHQANIQRFTQTTASCLDSIYEEHLEFFNIWGISKFYGDRRPDYATREGLIAALKSYGKPVELVSQLEPMSCIGLALRCLEEGFTAIEMTSTWDKIYAHLDSVDFLGTELQRDLIALGWTSYYWNPNPSNNAKWDAEDQKLNPLKPGTTWNPVWGGHAAHYNSVMKKGIYYNIPVHNAEDLVGFGSKQPSFFKSRPIFIGTAHAGYHVFPGRSGEVIEAHSMRDLNSKENLEFSEFNPLKSGGGPKWTPKERYRSGIIVIPPAP